MRSGDLRHSIELQSFTSTPNGMGGFSQVWATTTTVRAAIWPVSVVEQVRAGAPTAVGTHKVRIRYYSGLSAANRVKFGTRYFSIVSIVDKDEKGVQMDLLCQEVMA